MPASSSVSRQTVRLKLFGTLAVEGSGEIRRSRRALALLALTAAAGPDGIDRARVLALLWPDGDAERAANSFRQVLHGVRRDLGDGVFIAEGGRITLNASMFSVDLWEFTRALKANDLEQAAAVYRDPFLGAFHIAGLHEFDRWAEDERDRLRIDAVTVLRRLAEQAAAAGNHQEAVKRWRDIVAMDRLSCRNALGFLRALAAAGDRAGALDFARTYESLVRYELDTEPDEEFVQYVAQLRQATPARGSSALTPSATAPLAADLQALPSTSESSQSPQPPQPHEVELRPKIPPSFLTQSGQIKAPRLAAVVPTSGSQAGLLVRLPKPRAIKRLTIATAILVTLASVATAFEWSGGWTKTPSDSRQVVAILPFRTYEVGDSTLGPAITALVSKSLDGAGDLRTLAAPSVASALGKSWSQDAGFSDAQRVARKVGAQLVVTGDVVYRGGTARLSASLYDFHRGDVPPDELAVEGDTARILDLADDLATRLIAAHYDSPKDHLTRAAAFSAHSVAALKAYLRGEAALRSGRYAEASDEFERAAAAKKGFALAYYRLSIASERCGRDTLASVASELAISSSDSLPDRERRLLLSYAAWRDGRSEAAERMLRQILDDYPDDTEAWTILGEVVFHNNPLHGQSIVEARPVFEQLLELDPTNTDAVVHLARIAAVEGRQKAAIDLEKRARSLVSAPNVLERYASHVFSLGDSPGVKYVRRDLERSTPKHGPTLHSIDVAIDADDVFGTAAFARTLIDESMSASSRGFGRRLLAHAALAQGRWVEARAELDTAVVSERASSLEQLALAAALPFIPVSAAELRTIRDTLARWTVDHEVDSLIVQQHAGLHAPIRTYCIGLMSVRLGEFDAAARAAAELGSQVADVRAARLSRTLSKSLYARIAAAQGRAQEALIRLDEANWEGAAEVFAAEAADRFLRATLLESLGRTREAADWYSSIAQRAAYELPYLAPAELRLARMEQARGRRVAAATHLARAQALWSNADLAVSAAADSLLPKALANAKGLRSTAR
jgi:DNA-binding SARP family transcriptional activator/TolB-like protein